MFKFSLSLVLALALVTGSTPKAHAYSGGAEIVMAAVGAGSIVYGRARNAVTYRVIGWSLLVLGGSVMAYDGSALAVVGVVFLASSEMLIQLLGGDSRRYGGLNDTNGVQLAKVLDEVESDSILASKLRGDEGSDTLIIGSLARTLGMSTPDLGKSMNRAKLMADGIQNSRFGTGVKSITKQQLASILPAGGTPENNAALNQLVSNYLRLRNIDVRTI